MVYGVASYRAVIDLLGSGLSDYQIATQTGVKRGTVRNWRLATEAPRTIQRQEQARAWQVRDARSYCYLLGAYLGDGTVCVQKGVWLQIVNDRRYPGITDEILTSMANTFPESKPRRHPSSYGQSDVLCINHPAILRAFPQHGAGRKHLRSIELRDWQLELTRSHPGSLVRGLIHSDGCRCVNSFKTRLPTGRVAEYSYVRYFFSNLSSDIRAIFVEHCELLGIRVTQPNHGTWLSPIGRAWRSSSESWGPRHDRGRS